MNAKNIQLVSIINDLLFAACVCRDGTTILYNLIAADDIAWHIDDDPELFERVRAVTENTWRFDESDSMSRDEKAARRKVRATQAYHRCSDLLADLREETASNTDEA